MSTLAGAMQAGASSSGADMFTVMFVCDEPKVTKVERCSSNNSLRQAATRAFGQTLDLNRVSHFTIKDKFTDDGEVKVDDFDQELAVYTDKEVFPRMRFDVTMKPPAS